MLQWETALSTYRDQNGNTLAALSTGRPLLLIFLRHAGCTFCREALADVALKRADIEASGARIAIVHMRDQAEGLAFTTKYGLGDLSCFSDPSKALYEAFGLKRGSPLAVLTPTVIGRALHAGLVGGHGLGTPEGDTMQMPGVFLLQDGKLLREFRHKTVADRPDYVALAYAPSATVS